MFTPKFKKGDVISAYRNKNTNDMWVYVGGNNYWTEKNENSVEVVYTITDVTKRGYECKERKMLSYSVGETYFKKCSLSRTA